MDFLRTVSLFAVFYSSLIEILGAETVTVTTDNGNVIGQKIRFFLSSYPSVDTTIDEFRSIPYAKPPLGDLRFRKPESVEDWSEPWNATYFRPRCWQIAVENNDTHPQSEDCLYLNVWSPDTSKQNLPVMVWIHGGGFVEGASSDESVDGRVLVALNDVIMVSMNYRLNAFGFLATGDEELKGNYGLWDQNEAMKWVKQNIAAFGGDPDNISLFGQSAGGASVGHHLIAEQSWNYFHKALMISGNMMSPWGLETNIEKARSDAFLLGRLVGCEDSMTSEDLVACLRNKEAEQIIAGANAVLLTTTNVIPTVPVIDGEFITADPRLLLAQGKFKDCSIIAGNTLDDGSIVSVRAYPSQLLPPGRLKPTSDYPTFREKLEKFTYTFTNDLIVTAIEQQYIDWTKFEDPEANYFYTFMEVETDEAFHCTSDHTSRTYALNGNTVYRYRFSHLPETKFWPEAPAWVGVAHAEDLPFIFGYGFSPYRVPEWYFNPNEEELSLDIMRYFTNFAKTGNPNVGGDNDGNSDDESEWMEFKVPGLVVKDFKPGLQDLQGLQADHCKMWNDFVPSLVTYSGSLSEIEAQWREEITIWRYDDLYDWRLSFTDYQENKNECS